MTNPSTTDHKEHHHMDRAALSRSLAKAIAHKNAGNDTLAADWAAYLVHQLGAAEILAYPAGNTYEPAR